MKKRSSIWRDILFILLGVAGLYYAYQAASTGSTNWLTTTGWAETSYIRVESYGTGPDEREYFVEVTYVYYVEDVKYGGHSRKRFLSQVDAEEELALYRGEIPVYYNPQDPAASTLWREENKMNGYLAVIAGLIVIGLGMRIFRSRSLDR